MSAYDDLVAAVRTGDVSRVTALLRDDPTLAEQRPPVGPSALLMAAYVRHHDLTALLRSVVRCDVAEAAALGDDRTLRAILEARPADVSSYSGDGWTPLHLAAFFGHVSTVAELLDRGGEVRAFSRNGEANTPLHAALAGAASAAVVDRLLAAGADPQAAGGGGFRPLHIAATRGDRALVEALLRRGADPRDRTADGRTASALAAERGFPAVAELLAAAEGAAGAAAGTGR